jgi:hypothetical protein
MEFTKGELNTVLTDTSDDTSVRFAIGGEELEVEGIDPYDEMGDVWVTLRPKGENPGKHWYVGHRPTEADE